jgi:hypothetical protein
MSENPPEGGVPGQTTRSGRTEERLSGRAQRKIQAEQARKRRTLFIAGGAVAAAALAALLILIFSRQPQMPPVAVAPEIAEGVAYSGRTMGNPDAPVTVVEWGDYQ